MAQSDKRTLLCLGTRRQGSGPNLAVVSDLPPPRQRGALSIRDVERIVDSTLESLPDWVVSEIENLTVVVEDWPSSDQDPSGLGLLGLYEGVSLEERGVDYFGTAPDRITIFRGPHLQMGLSRAETAGEVRRTVLHELGHHLGINDQRLHELGWD